MGTATGGTTATKLPGYEMRISIDKGIAYSLPSSVTWFLGAPLLVILPGVYAKYFGLSLTSIAMVLLIARLFDAITDPAVGYLSDYYKQRTGTRKPLIVMGSIGLIISSYLLFVPLVEVTTSYYLICLLLYYLFWTIAEVSHLSWGGELAPHYQDKTRIYTLRGVFTYIGNLLFFMIPLLGMWGTREFTPAVLKWSVLVCAIVAVPILFYCIRTVPDGPASAINTEESFQSVRDSILQNRPFLLFLVIYLFLGIGLGMWVSTAYFFIDAYLDLGEKLAITLTLSILAGAVSMGLWYKLSDWFSKKCAWAMGMVLGVVSLLGFGLLTPGAQSFVPLIALMCCTHCALATAHTLAPALLSDIVDYSHWKFGACRGATFFSLFTFFTKANMSFGTALGLGVTGWYGFEPTATMHSDDDLFGLFLSFSYIPALLLLLSVGLIMLIPIDARRHQIIQRRLASRGRIQRTQEEH